MEIQAGEFAHERLEVFVLALELVEEIDQLAVRARGVRKHLGWQMHRAACSVPLNIAEANGRYSGPDKAQYLVIATGSALECAAAVDIAARLGLVSLDEHARLRTLLLQITRMLVALTRTVRQRPPPGS